MGALEIPQWKLMLEKFEVHSGILYTSDFRDDVHLYNEWRRAMCDLDKRGYVIKRQKMSPKLWKYTLVETEPNGQELLCLR